MLSLYYLHLHSFNYNFKKGVRNGLNNLDIFDPGIIDGIETCKFTQTFWMNADIQFSHFNQNKLEKKYIPFRSAIIKALIVNIIALICK